MNLKLKGLLLFLPVLLFSGVCGYLIGVGITTPSIVVEGDAWDEVSMTEIEYEQTVVSQTVIDSHSEVKGSFDTSDIPSKFNHCSNEDKIGWIYYPNICNYPILFSGDNYYLNHTVNKKYSSNGAIFCDAASTSFFDEYTLIHGHHLRNGKMFTQLKKLKKKSFFKNNRHFYIYSPDNNAVFCYRTIAVTIVNGSKEAIPGSFKTDADREAYIRKLINRSKFSCNFTEDELKSTVVLHTCDYTFKNAHLLVLGVKETEVLNSG